MRRRIYEIITDDCEVDGNAAQLYDSLMIIVILVSLLPLCFKEITHEILVLEWITTAIFLLDYLMRWLCADLMSNGNRYSFAVYPFTPLALIDLVSILPTFLHVSQVLRLSRLVRLMRIARAIKLIHHSRSVQLVLRVLERERTALLTVLVLACGYVFISALVIFNVEPDTFDNFFEALYWATVSLTTMGYGDIAPTSDVGRVVTMMSSFIGIAVVALPAGIITAGYTHEIQEMYDREDDENGLDD